MCGSSRLFLIPGSQHLLSTNVFCAHMWPFGYLLLSPPVRMAWCLLMSVAQLLGHGGDQPLWPWNAAPLQSTSLFSQLWGASSHLISRGHLDSRLGFLMGQGGRSGLASSKRSALAQQLPWPRVPAAPRHSELGLICSRGLGHSWHQPVNPALSSRAEPWIKSQPLFSFLRRTHARCGTS